ncbi:MAG: peptidoglycan/LPS O-acetylase OafA/YrhL [Ancylomarina sp.]|jgi:peptidoglycan/LPS O-acetylase OafA/YrhL
MKNTNYLYGLNTLRFMAAFFIIAMHTQNNQTLMNLPRLPDMAFLYKGAVSFFFTLSGFLITYIRIGEYEKSGDINMRKFFSNRFYRLAPVYYLVIAFGLLFYWIIVPFLGIESHTDYKLNLALILYLAFLPNLMNSMYHVGGALNVSWSIGAQEQFYWILIPFMKYRFKHLPVFLISVTALSVFMSIGNAYNLFGLSIQMQAFVHTLRLHFMSIGALLGYYLYYKKEGLLSLWIFSKKWLQALLFLSLVAWYGFNTDSKFIKATITLPLSLLYGWLIINVAVNPRNIIKLDNPFFDWIGQRTYGIYMIHMFVIYLVSFFYSKTEFLFENFALYISCFYLMVFGLSIGLAHLSFTYLEQPIIQRIKEIKEKNKILIPEKIKV